MNKRQDKSLTGSEEKYIEKLENKNNIEISNYSFNNTNYKTTEEKYNFSMQTKTTGDFIYLNASVFPFMDKNILYKQERKLPVEFSYPETHIINCIVKIPEGYRVEELPKGTQLSVCKDGISCLYSANINEGFINISLAYKMNRILYPLTEYPNLREFFGMVSSLSMSNIILKKE